MAWDALTPMLCVSDVTASVEFYRDRLGFQLDGQYDHEGTVFWSHLSRDGARLMVTLGHDHDEAGESIPLQRAPGQHRDVLLYIYCPDAAEVREELVARGVEASELTVQFYGLREFGVTDPDGFQVFFGSETDEPPTPCVE